MTLGDQMVVLSYLGDQNAEQCYYCEELCSEILIALCYSSRIAVISSATIICTQGRDECRSEGGSFGSVQLRVMFIKFHTQRVKSDPVYSQFG
jgi:hypothetical protein